MMQKYVERHKQVILGLASLALQFLYSDMALAGKCYGLKDCHACTTCGYCKHCNMPGQTQFCGVYQGNNAPKQPQLKVKAKLLPAQ